MKLVIEVKGAVAPKENDIIVFDKANECWRVVSKATFLGGIRKEFSALEKRMQSVEAKCTQAQNDVSTMAKIMKEGMK